MKIGKPVLRYLAETLGGHFDPPSPNRVNPVRIGGCFPPGTRFSVNNFENNKVPQSKRGDFSKDLMPNKVKVTNF